tara:strand:+ start:317 stop:643 length:327 start_codon:yes stop_codon:yes gene_type:complete
MKSKRNSDFTLKLGNLFLAGVLSIVPTAITIFIFYLYGINICNNLVSSNLIYNKTTSSDISLCLQEVNDINYKYLLFIWIVITIPTWSWFYLNHSRRKTLARKQSDNK